MPDSSAPAFTADVPASEELLHVLLNVSLTGIMILRPVYDAGGTDIIDLAWVHLNPAAQQMLKLPERPNQSFLTLFPTAAVAGVYNFYRDTFLSGKLEHRQNNYQHDGLDGYYLLAAQRQGEVLVVSFTDTNDQPRTAVEQALRASQARELEARAEAEAERNLLQAVLTQSPVAIGLLQGDDCVVTAANDLLCAMWGYSPAQILGRPLLEGVPEMRGHGFTELMREVAHTRVPFVGTEVPAELLREGRLETRYYNFVYQPLYGRQGEVMGIIDIAADVTEQVLARRQVQTLNEELASINEELRASNDEFLTANSALALSQQALYSLNQELEGRVVERTQQLQQQQAVLRQVLTQLPASISTLTGPDHRYSFFNDHYRWISDNRPYLGRTIAEVFPEAAEQGFIKLLDQVYATGEPYVGVEVLAQGHNPATGQSESVYLDIVYQPLRDEREQITGILAFVLDSTEKVRARHAIEAAAQRLRLLTDALPVLIAYLDRERRYQFVNHAYRTWFNQDPAALLGRPVREVVGEKAYVAAQGYMDRALAGERLAFEARMPYREGFVRYIHTDYIPDVRNGEVQGFYSLVTDVTDQVQAREQVQELNEELAAINEEMQVANEELRDTNDRLSHTNVDLDTFVYTASHDLKAPIANIEGLLLALREQLPAPVQQDPDVTHLLDLMHGSVARFQRTLGQLTDISKLQQAHTEPAEALDLAAEVEAVRLDLAPALAAAGGQFTVDVSACPTLRFSPKNLRSILYNLLSNAIKYRDSARPLQVRLYAYCTDGQALLEVHDNGMGLTEEQQGKLFVMFRRLHTHVEGTGVGLYMVKRIAENAGGTIRVQSQPGVGSTFTAVLPDLS
ncbi:PAS domain-containing protein [Hymenobacter terrenus]|uniref:PAS domain-containing protein n=1 Tax=Hymenobacter terrenus TaxID=1629124 RepID=UPI0006199DA9|nr:PAS domain-containing protein [Hymenobacter terrenus]